jgi:hypothetical protein
MEAVVDELSDAGKGLYEQKLYKEAAAIFEISTSNKESKIICLTISLRKFIVF